MLVNFNYKIDDVTVTKSQAYQSMIRASIRQGYDLNVMSQYWSGIHDDEFTLAARMEIIDMLRKVMLKGLNVVFTMEKEQ